jgi:hypothetical protein
MTLASLFVASESECCVGGAIDDAVEFRALVQPHIDYHRGTDVPPKNHAVCLIIICCVFLNLYQKNNVLRLPFQVHHHWGHW